MNKTITAVILISLISISGLRGQVTNGTVTYEEMIKIEIKLEGEMAARFRDMPKERKSTRLLYFNEEASLYRRPKVDQHRQDAEFRGQGRGMGMRMGMMDPDHMIYVDLGKNMVLEKREFMTRMFLIKKEVPESNWKITGNQKMILDYPCMEATMKDTAGRVTRAWFTPAIPVQSGPGLVCNLPGLVLEVDVDNGRRTITAQSIDTESPGKDMLRKPKEGKKVTQEEFDKIVAEKMEEMGIEPGMGPGRGRGMHIIRIHQ